MKYKIDILRSDVRKNGVGKSSVIDVNRKTFVEHEYSMPCSDSTILVEVNGETKVLFSNYKKIYLDTSLYDEDHEFNLQSGNLVIIDFLDTENGQIPQGYKEIDRIEKQSYQTIYYSPHFDLKYNNDFDEVDKYDISLDQFIKQDLEDNERKGTNENGWRF